MVVGNPDHSLQADIVFVMEGTATNGAYINDLKTNYIIPTLECFTQGNIDERDYISENSNAYGIVVYQAADCLPHPSSDTFGPFSNASRLLNALDKLELIGGKGESHANIAEGLATALQCFEELQHKREPGVPAQKHCILVCNSPPYSLPVMESYQFSGKTAEQLAAILLERGINLSILSPRKIPALFKLFEKAGGDLSTSQTKNYAKDPRHLVLLKGFCLKERPISPPPGVVGTQPQPNTTTNISLPSPLSNNDSPMSNAQQTNQTLLGQNGQPGVPSSVGQGPVFRPNQIQTGLQQPMPQHSQGMVGGMVGVGRPGPGYLGGPQFNQQPLQPPGYPGMAGRPPRWSMMPPQPRQPVPNTQGSALIAQLTQPPSSMAAPTNVNVNQFGQMSNPSQMNPQQAAIRMSMLNNQTNQQTTGPTTMTQNQQPVSSQANVNVSGQQPQQSMVNQQVSAANVVTVQAPVTSQANATQQNQQMATRERHTIWHGVLEWIEKAKNPTDQQKLTRHVPCSVSTTLKDGEPELKADSWPQKLIMQLMPKQLIGSIGGMYLRNSKSVLFHPQNCEALESLTKVMSTGFAGCVHFTSLPSPATCDIKVLILLYTAEKRAYLGFIPNDQAAFVDRLRKVIQQQKSSQQLGRQGQVGTGVPGAAGIPSAPGQQMGAQQQINTPISQSPNSQQGIMMSQTNTMAMGGGQITQNVVTSTSQPNQQAGIGVLGQQVNPSTMSPRMSLQGMPQQGPPTSQNQQTATNQGMRPNMMGVPQQRPPFDHLEAARQQNLEKILQLKQTLEAAQQQEAQYKSQLEIISHMKTQQLQEALQVAQQQEMQYKLQMDMQQQQQRQITPQGGPQPAANQQRMMRPVLSNNPGLRHLLQQQPQYRQQLIGMQQMSGAGPRPQQMGQQMQNTTNQTQQFEDVSNFDFM